MGGETTGKADDMNNTAFSSLADFKAAFIDVLHTVATHGLLPSDLRGYVSVRASIVEGFAVDRGYIRRYGAGWELTPSGNKRAAELAGAA